MPESERELNYSIVNRADKALHLAKIQQRQALKILAEMDCSSQDAEFPVAMATLMQVLATNYAALRPK